MTFALERRAIEARFAANFTAVAADRIAYENVDFRQPTSGTWVRLSIRNGDAFQASAAARPLNRYGGLIIVDCFAVEKTGTDAARALADSAAAVFRNVQFSSGDSGTITTFVPTMKSVGVVDGWFHISMWVRFHRDKVD